MARRAKASGFDLSAAISAAEATAPSSSSKSSELAHPRIKEILAELAPRVWAGRMTWSVARRVIDMACEAESLPRPRVSTQTIAAYARRYFYRG